jgi:hypothetical protein
MMMRTTGRSLWSGLRSSSVLTSQRMRLSAAAACPDGFAFYQEFISEAEEAALSRALDSRFKKRRYERDHWDSVIVNYRETEAPSDAVFALEEQYALAPTDRQAHNSRALPREQG